MNSQYYNVLFTKLINFNTATLIDCPCQPKLVNIFLVTVDTASVILTFETFKFQFFQNKLYLLYVPTKNHMESIKFGFSGGNAVGPPLHLCWNFSCRVSRIHLLKRSVPWDSIFLKINPIYFIKFVNLRKKTSWSMLVWCSQLFGLLLIHPDWWSSLLFDWRIVNKTACTNDECYFYVANICCKSVSIFTALKLLLQFTERHHTFCFILIRKHDCIENKTFLFIQYNRIKNHQSSL